MAEETTKAIEGEVIQQDPDAVRLGSAGRPGRPSDMTPPVVAKLIVAFNNGYNIGEACDYADIHRTTYYRWLEKDDQFSYKMSQAQAMPNRKAKEVVLSALNQGDISAAKWWLERKDPEFKNKGELVVPPGQATTEEKLKEFMDDTDDGAYPSLDAGPAHAEREQPPAENITDSGDEVAPGPPDIS